MSTSTNPNRCIECREPVVGQSLYCPACEAARPDPKAMQARIKEMHQTWQKETGLVIPLHPHRELAWTALISSGYTPDDVTTLARHLWKGIRARTRNLGALKFPNFTDTDRFENDIAEARMLKPADTSGRVPSTPSLPTPAQENDRVKPEDFRGLKSLIANASRN